MIRAKGDFLLLPSSGTQQKVSICADHDGFFLPAVSS